MTLPVIAGINGLPHIELAHDAGSIAHVYLNGAHVTSWVPVGWHSLLYLSRLAKFEKGRGIRGGIPVVFPQFADNGPLPKHGWVRKAEWIVAGEQERNDAEGSIRARLITEDDEASRKIWPHRYRAELDVTLGESSLTVALSVANTGDESFSFTSAFHNYFSVADIRESAIEGLTGASFLDKTQDFSSNVDSAEKLVIDRETDRVYQGAPARVLLKDHASGTSLEIAAAGFPDIVVWNPWEEGVKQVSNMPEDDYLRLVCIEPAIAVTPVTLAPGGRWTGSQHLVVHST